MLEPNFEEADGLGNTWKNDFIGTMYFDVININKLKIILANFKSLRKRFDFGKKFR